MQIAYPRFSAYPLGVLLLVVASLFGPGVADAEEGEARPWGRVSKPTLTPPESTRHNGYLGRYNPWEKSRDNGSSEPPRYRQRGDNDPSTRAPEAAPRFVAPGQSELPRYAPAAPGYGPMAGEVYRAPPLPYTVTPGLAPWGGVPDPGYGNYWRSPYNSLQPEPGNSWSDMRR